MRLFSRITSLFGRSQKPPSGFDVAPVSTEAQHNYYFTDASALISPYMRLHNIPAKSARSRAAQEDIVRGISLLRAVLAYNPAHWNSWWFMGKAYQLLDSPEQACDAFGRSYAIQDKHPDVAREYVASCLELGRISEAVPAGERAVELSPQNAGLRANLALVYMVAGRLQDAQSAIHKSLEMDPTDHISLALSKAIQEIADGKRPQPRTLRELEGRGERR